MSYNQPGDHGCHNDDIPRVTDVDQIEAPTPTTYHDTDNKILNRNEARLRARSYLEDAEESAEAVRKMSDLLKFNNEQCNYLVGKLCVAVQIASSFMEELGRKVVGTTSKENDTDFVEIFELLMVLGKQIESFVGGCCKDNWIQAAMVLSNTSEYVSSLGFNLDLCIVAFGKEHKASGCLTLDEVDGMNKSEAELVKQKASVDAESLTKKVVRALNFLHGEDRDLASYLLQRLLEIKGIPSFGSGTFLSNLFAWVKSGKQVGRGASATVFKAMWLGIQVAMKTFDGPENVEFDKEVEILSRLCHPNITSVFCFTKDTRSCSIVMELMDGDLNQLINQLMRSSDSPPFSILEAVDMMLQIGEGVNYLHKKGIVHRDLKSGNILYKAVQVKDVGIRCAHVKVADFGLSKARATNTVTFSNLSRNTGTNRWMPPEVIQMSDGNQGGLPSNVDLLPKYPFKLDSYSFGLVCYEILCGRLPFWECDNVNEVKRKILNKERPLLPCKPSECPLLLKNLIQRCWSHEPEKRPSFDEICTELKYIQYLLMTGGSRMHGVVDCQMEEKIADGKSTMSESGHLDCKGHFEPGLYHMPSTVDLVGPVTEAWSEGLQMSVCVNTSADYLTLPPKNSMDKSPSTRDRLKSSSNPMACSYLQYLQLVGEIGHLTSLTTSDLVRCGGLEQLPTLLRELPGLTTLNLEGCEGLPLLPVEIGQLKGLNTLNLRKCAGLRHLPAEIGQLTSLTTFNLGGCEGLEQLPCEIGQMTSLKTLKLWGCRGLLQLPPEIGQLTSLTTFNLWGCGGLEQLPSEIGQLTGLTILKLAGCGGLKQLPHEIGQLTSLTTLDLDGCVSLQQLPVEIGQLTGLTTLNLRKCIGLQQLPTEIGQLTSLKTLNLRRCEGLQQLPIEIGELTGLTILNLRGCEGLK